MTSHAHGSLCARLCLTALTVVALLAVFAAPAFAEDDAEWTFGLYIAADNNLESAWDDINVPALLGIPASDDVHIVALVDRLSTETTELVEFEGDAATVVDTYPEMNFGDPENLQWFVEELAARYPSERLAVDLWDHGGAWRGICYDDSSDKDRITMPELRASIVAAGVPIDILAFDACNMADMAVAYEVALSELVDIMVASEEMIPFAGFAYDLMLAPVALEPGRTPEQVATDMVDGWGAYYDGVGGYTMVCLSAIDVREVRAAIPALQTWVQRMTAGVPLFKQDYKMALVKTWTALNSWQYDLISLCDRLALSPDLKQADGMKLKSATVAVAEAMRGAVIANHTTRWTAGATGIAVWWANAADWTSYEELFGANTAFAAPVPIGVGWYDLLQTYYAN